MTDIATRLHHLCFCLLVSGSLPRDLSQYHSTAWNDFFTTPKQEERHGRIYGDGVAAPALDAHGSHSLSISIFILAFRECRWPDALLTCRATDSHSNGRRPGAGGWRLGAKEPKAPVAQREEFTSDWWRWRRQVLRANQMDRTNHIMERGMKKGANWHRLPDNGWRGKISMSFNEEKQECSRYKTYSGCVDIFTLNTC